LIPKKLDKVYKNTTDNEKSPQEILDLYIVTEDEEIFQLIFVN